LTPRPEERELTLGFSPCPNDTLIFYGLVHGRVPSSFRFRPVLADVEELNGRGLRAELDVTKVSYHAAALLMGQYALLKSGGALGRGCGPLLVAMEERKLSALRGARIAIPGRMTTAFLLLRLFDPDLGEGAVEMPFHRIMPAVAEGRVDAGLIIHESRFTYPLFGLVQLLDLGEWWESTTGLPIPLGAIMARRDLGPSMISRIDAQVRASVSYGREHYPEARSYILEHAQEMDETVVRQHIDLYVNDYSVDPGPTGEEAVREFFRRAAAAGLVTHAYPKPFT